MKIPFNKPYLTGKELDYIQQAVVTGKISGNGEFTRRCQQFFEEKYGFQKCLLTSSCTDALEMAAILLDIQPGDEVIMPSFTFVSTANAFVLRGARIVFVDSKSDHPNMDEQLIEELISPRTKAIIVVHYGGVACEMDTIQGIAKRHGLKVVEDAAQSIDSYYHGQALGGIGDLGCFSFHETKNIQCGEGGMLVINDPGMIKRAETIWEKGTDRAAFFRGEVDKYGWKDIGSSFLASEISAAFLWAQLENLDKIQERRKAIWNDYFELFSKGISKENSLGKVYKSILLNAATKEVESSRINPNYHDGLNAASNLESNTFPFIHNSDLKASSHLFYLIFPTIQSRTAYADALGEKGILAVFHYQSLHQSEYVRKNFPEQSRRELPHSDRYSDCLLRLPLFYELPEVAQYHFD